MCGEKIRHLRLHSKMSQEELADKLAVSRQTISKWETGVCLPDTEKIVKICQLFNCSSDTLLNDNISLNTMALSEKTINAKNSKYKFIMALIIAESILLVTIIFASQFIPSKKTIIQNTNVSNEYHNTTTSELIKDSIEVKEFFPFLKTYHLRILFVSACIDLGANVIYLIYTEKRKTNEKC
ncbi:helix-turn-helix transcriptional regulator [uncultured Eubacterium sp.]|uniref:helix-turn-helix domain-containing protein n=1 Tax=uncultured Eubacterium sp. TaxID=165185 RepID=UPI0025EC4D8B|nr:helix-turn-helix transcriptional regulator [uncultured Eubacterium sp.]